MTRAERNAVQAQKIKDTLAAKRRELAIVQARQRSAERTQRDKRRYHVGALADEAKLLVWDNATLARLFQLLTPLTQMPTPEAVLESLLADAAREDTETPPGSQSSACPELDSGAGAAAGPCLLTSLPSDASAVSRKEGRGRAVCPLEPCQQLYGAR